MSPEPIHDTVRIKNQIFSIILVFLMLLSCRKEGYELVEAPLGMNLGANSRVATLMLRTSMNDGSNDNIIDRANCFNVRLPITVDANNQQIIVNSENDFDLIEAIFDEFSNDEDMLEITFPIEVVLIDFSEVRINTQAEFTDLVNSCAGENVDDDDIECIDFLYPINTFIYNKTKESTSRISITDDKQLYNFINGLNDNLVASIDFPIKMVLWDKTETTINNLNVLETVIETADNSCDEDDDFDYNDDDIPVISNGEFSDLLTSCNLEIKEFEVNGQDLETTYDQYVFMFNANGSISAGLNGVASSGLWVITTDNNDNEVLSIVMDSLINFNNDWNLSEIKLEDGKTIIKLKKDEDELEFHQNCN